MMNLLYAGAFVGVVLVFVYAAWTLFELVDARECQQREQHGLMTERNWLRLQVFDLEFKIYAEQLRQPGPFDDEIEVAVASFLAEVDQWGTQ
jgi:hypothetical protein